MSRQQALGRGCCALTLGFLMAGCEADTEPLSELRLPNDAGSEDTGPFDTGVAPNLDAGSMPTPIRCSTPNPAGCVSDSCPPNQVCDAHLGCLPSSCVCGLDGTWSCTDDCGGGICRPIELEFRLRFDSDVDGQTVWAQSGGGQPWVAVYDDAGNNVQIDADCGQCSCDACGNCPLCGFAPAVVTRFGSRFGPMERSWDTITHPSGTCATSPGSSVACQQYLPLAPGRYTARFCFGYQVVQTPEGDFVDNPVCRDVPFDFPTFNNVIEYYHCDCG